MKHSIRLLILFTLFASLVLSGSAQDGFADGTEISLLQWSHFVPSYDVWFDEYAAGWGEDNNVGVSVDHGCPRV